MAQGKRITIQDIAKKANVSKSTVSRVLNATTPVAPEKETAVLAAMKELDYQPNIFARGLAGGNSLTIGTLTQNVGSPFYANVMRGIIAGFEDSPYSTFFADGRWQPEIERKSLQVFLGRQVDGLIIIGGTLTGPELIKIAKKTPIIIVARDVPELEDRCLFADNFQAAYQATQHLIDAGHRRIAHITGVPAHQDSRRRQEGYEKALTDAGIAVDPNLIVEGNFRRQSGVLATEALLARGQSFSAIFAANDQMAAGVRLALFRKGIRIPQDISLVGFDNQPESAYMTPPLTTVRQPSDELGEEAAKFMLHILKKNPYTPPKFETKLIIRESVSRFF